MIRRNIEFKAGFVLFRGYAHCCWQSIEKFINYLLSSILVELLLRSSELFALSKQKTIYWKTHSRCFTCRSCGISAKGGKDGEKSTNRPLKGANNPRGDMSFLPGPRKMSDGAHRGGK